MHVRAAGPGRHYVSAPQELPQTIEWYLAHDGARARIAARGHAFVTQQLTLVRSVTRVLALLEERLGHAS